MEPETRTVRIVDRSTWGTPGPYPRILAVTVPWVCPQCGGPRGEPRDYRFFENDDSHVCDRWENICGHIDRYDAVLAEAQAYQSQIRTV